MQLVLKDGKIKNVKLTPDNYELFSIYQELGSEEEILQYQGCYETYKFINGIKEFLYKEIHDWNDVKVFFTADDIFDLLDSADDAFNIAQEC